MSLEQIVAVVSALIAVISALVSVRTLKVQRYISKYAAAYTYLSTAEAMFRERPELLELHGLDLKVLEEIGVTPDEVLYLINSFTGTDLYFRIEGTRPAKLTTYRKALLNTPKVQKVWEKIIRGRFISEGAFTEAVDRYYHSQRLLAEKKGESSKPV